MAKQKNTDQVTDQVETGVPAGKRFSLIDAKNPKMGNILKHILTSSPEDPMGKLNGFLMAVAVMTPVITDVISKSNLPEVASEALENQIKAIDEKIKAIGSEADVVSKTIDDQISLLQKQREEARKPFSERVVEQVTKRSEVVTNLNTTLEPLTKAINELKAEIIKKSCEVLPTVLPNVKGEDLEKKASEYVDQMLEIDQPLVGVTSAPRASTGTGRGRGGSSKVRITKGSEVMEFGSLNAARAYAYEKKEGKAPQYQANSPACEKYLQNAGFSVELI